MGTQETDVFGMRTMWDSMTPLLTRLRTGLGDGADLRVLYQAIGPGQFIHLSRKHKIAEALTLAGVLRFLRCDPAIAMTATPGIKRLARLVIADRAAGYDAEHGLPSAPTDA